jgi:hypothetical protein
MDVLMGEKKTDGLKLNDDLISMTKKELLHALKQSRGFLNYSSRRLNTEKTLLASLVERYKQENSPNPEFERNVKAVQEAAVMFEYINMAYEQMIKFAYVCFDEKGGIESNKSKKKKSKVTNPEGRNG